MKCATIYCIPENDGRTLSFYVRQSNEDHFLFMHRFNSTAYEFYRNGVALEKAMSFKYGKKLNCSLMTKISEKILRYLRYIEKEYDMVILEKTKRIHHERLRNAA